MCGATRLCALRNATLQRTFCFNTSIVEFLSFFWFHLSCSAMNQKKQHHSYLFCCGCTLIRHAVEQSLRACGSETNGGREPLDLLKRRRRLKKRFLKRGQRRLKSLEQCRCVGTVCTAVAGRPRVQLGRVGRKSKEVLQREPI